jgi:hypothetical protein
MVEKIPHDLDMAVLLFHERHMTVFEDYQL